MFEFLHKIGFAICHQLPERTFHIHDDQMPLCSRCTGIYLGFFITIVFYFFTKFIRHKKPVIPPSLPLSIISLVFMLSMIFNAISPIFGVPTNNLARFITGILFGFSIPLFLIPAFNFSSKAKYDDEKIINTRNYIILLSIICGMIIPVITQNNLILLIFSYISIFGLILFILLVNASLVMIVLDKVKRIKYSPYYYALLLGSTLTGVELYLFSLMHIEIIEKFIN